MKIEMMQYADGTKVGHMVGDRSPEEVAREAARLSCGASTSLRAEYEAWARGALDAIVAYARDRGQDVIARVEAPLGERDIRDGVLWIEAGTLCARIGRASRAWPYNPTAFAWEAMPGESQTDVEVPGLDPQGPSFFPEG